MAALIPAAVGAGAALFATGDAKVGQNTFRSTDFKDTNGYNPNAQYLGGNKNFAGQEAGRLGDASAAADNRAAIQANYGQANTARANALGDRANAYGDRNLSYGARGSQADALGMMQSAALGQQPSVAQMQMQQGQSRALADQMSMAASQNPGPGAALAARGAMANAANIQSATAANTAQLRAQETSDARNAYLGGALGMGGQDISRMGADTSLMNQSLGMYGQDSSNANAQAGFGLASRAQNDARSLAYQQMRQQLMAQEAQRAMGNNALLAGTHQSADALNSGINRENAGNEKDFFKFGMGSISGGMQAGVAGAGGGGLGGGGYPGAPGAGGNPTYGDPGY